LFFNFFEDKSPKVKEELVKIKCKLILSIKEKINQSRLFDDYFWNVDIEIENLEQTINFHSLAILDLYLKIFMEEFIIQTFLEYETKNKEIFLRIDKDFWNQKQNDYNLFVNEKEEIFYSKIRG